MAQRYSTELELDSSQYWSIADTAALDIAGNMTISCWVKFESVPGSGAIQTFISKFRTDGTQARSYMLGQFNDSGTQKLILQIGNGSSTSAQVVVNWTPSVDTWYHIGVIYTAAGGTADFFVNGAQQGTQQSGLATSIGDGTAPFCIGASSNDTPSYFLDGKIADVRLWARALSAAEMEDMFTDPLTVSNGSNLTGWWFLYNTLDSGKAHDEGSNDLDLTNNGTATFTTDFPWHKWIAETEVAGAPVEIGTSSIANFYTSASEVAGAPTDTIEQAHFGWENQDKTAAVSWTNQDKT